MSDNRIYLGTRSAYLCWQSWMLLEHTVVAICLPPNQQHRSSTRGFFFCRDKYCLVPPSSLRLSHKLCCLQQKLWELLASQKKPCCLSKTGLNNKAHEFAFIKGVNPDQTQASGASFVHPFPYLRNTSTLRIFQVKEDLGREWICVEEAKGGIRVLTKLRAASLSNTPAGASETMGSVSKQETWMNILECNCP